LILWNAAAMLPHCSIVASRPAGYSGSVRLDTFSVVGLSGLNEAEARKLLVNWFTAVKDARPHEQADKLWGTVQLNRRLSKVVRAHRADAGAAFFLFKRSNAPVAKRPINPRNLLSNQPTNLPCVTPHPRCAL
jgi:hypothetical protein